jgi:hypothetical protein
MVAWPQAPGQDIRGVSPLSPHGGQERECMEGTEDQV